MTQSENYFGKMYPPPPPELDFKKGKLIRHVYTCHYWNQIETSGLLLYPLKTLEILQFSL